jgi:formylglycine-generating enzyme required for sulfatase activity
VVNVSWNDIQEFVDWMNSRFDGSPYRLPSEAEWEYAARAGSDTAFWWGNRISPDQANYNGGVAYNNGPTGVYREHTLPVGSFKANRFGLYDVHGNVSERVQDCFNVYAGAPTNGSARTDGSCNSPVPRVTRGGSWTVSPWFLRSADRGWEWPENSNWSVGFRLARTLAP